MAGELVWLLPLADKRVVRPSKDRSVLRHFYDSAALYGKLKANGKSWRAARSTMERYSLFAVVARRSERLPPRWHWLW